MSRQIMNVLLSALTMKCPVNSSFPFSSEDLKKCLKFIVYCGYMMSAKPCILMTIPAMFM